MAMYCLPLVVIAPRQLVLEGGSHGFSAASDSGKGCAVSWFCMLDKLLTSSTSVYAK